MPGTRSFMRTATSFVVEECPSRADRVERMVASGYIAEVALR
jgi:hypothetical protein